MALSDYTLGESEPPSFYDFEPEEYSLGGNPNTPPAPEPPSYYANYPTGEGGSGWGYTPPVYSAPETTEPATDGRPWWKKVDTRPWWKKQGLGDWGESGGGSSGGGTGFSSGITLPQPYISDRAPPPDVPEFSPYEMPERGTAPVFEAPEWDKSEINRLSQEHAAAPIRTLREAYQRTAARLPTNPQSRLLLKDALAGYGSGLESAISGARRTARGEYGQKHGREFQEASMNYQGAQREFEQDYAARLTEAQQKADIENRNKMMKYQADYADYLRGYKNY